MSGWSRTIAVPLRVVRLIGALGLLGYSAMLAVRVRAGGAHHVGDDVVAYAYLLCAFIAVATAVDYLVLRSNATKWHDRIIDSIVLCGLAAWLGLHLSGTIYSHGSMFNR
jgi:hypothetical protein